MTDVIVRPEGAVEVGGDRRATIRFMPGGSGANVASWLASLGADVVFAGRVGRSEAQYHREALAACGVTPRLAVDDETPTGTLVALLSAGGERSFLTDRGANDRLCGDDLPASLLDGAMLLHVSGYSLVSAGPRDAVLNLIGEARRRGLSVSVDPASYPFLRDIGPERFIEWTGGADLFFPNVAEAAILADSEDRDAQLGRLTLCYPTVVIKEGAGGAVAAKAGTAERWSAGAPPVNAVDTTGAGDAFVAGFLKAHLDGETIGVCLTEGIRAGTCAIGRLGGRPAARDMAGSPPPFP